MSDHIAEPMTDNTALREILGEVRLLEGVLRQTYDSVTPNNAQAVAADDPYVREAAENIVKTVVTNVGDDNDILVYEEGALVARLAPRDTWTSPLTGSGEITVTAEDGLPSTASIATYTKG